MAKGDCYLGSKNRFPAVIMTACRHEGPEIHQLAQKIITQNNYSSFLLQLEIAEALNQTVWDIYN